MIKNPDDKLRDDVQAEIALEQIKKRSPLLANLRSPEFTPMEKLIPVILAVLIIYYSFSVFPNNMDATLLIAFLVTLTFSTSSYQSNLSNRRIEALIELIGEDNLLKIKTTSPKKQKNS